MATMRVSWVSELPAEYVPDPLLVERAARWGLPLDHIPSVIDRVWVIGRLGEPPHRMIVTEIADALDCHPRTVKTYRSMWKMSGLAEVADTSGPIRIPIVTNPAYRCRPKLPR